MTLLESNLIVHVTRCDWLVYLAQVLRDWSKGGGALKRIRKPWTRTTLTPKRLQMRFTDTTKDYRNLS